MALDGPAGDPPQHPLERCEPLEGDVRSHAAALGGDGVSVVFRVAGVRFRFDGEAHDRWS